VTTSIPTPRPADARRLEAPARTRPNIVALLVAGGPTNGLVTNLVLWVGSVLMILSALIHLHLWMTGYQHIPTIGPLFLLQVIAGIAIALGSGVIRRVWAALVALGFVASTIGGFLLSVTVGLFGFKDSWSAPYAQMAFGIEIAALVVLAVGGGLCLRRAAKRAP
jgi:hypothetical protein